MIIINLSYYYLTISTKKHASSNLKNLKQKLKMIELPIKGYMKDTNTFSIPLSSLIWVAGRLLDGLFLMACRQGNLFEYRISNEK